MLDPVNVNANGLTLRGVEFDYKTPRYHNYNVTLQTEILANHSVEVGYVGTQGTQPRNLHRHEQRDAAPAAGDQPAELRAVARFRARVAAGSGRLA